MESPVVTIKGGKVKGSVTHLETKGAKPVYTFRNIPFAKPPVGRLRFMPPEPADHWTGVRDGTVIGNMPMQSTELEEATAELFPLKMPCAAEQIQLNEDCLHVSVYTAQPGKRKKLPVMVWLYGGEFSMGSEVSYDGRALAGLCDVVVVVPNYRVNIFGFLTMGASSKCPGNAGLLDQNMALRWVRENIESFGGDKGNVTIFGESAGAISVHYHVMSPLSRGLFHKAISHSGQATMPGLFLSDDSCDKNLKAVLKQLKIEEGDDQKVLKELQKVPAEKLIEAQAELAMEKVAFFPTMDGKFLTKTPQQNMAGKNFGRVPYIIGYNSTEGGGLLAQATVPNFLKGLTEEECKNSMFLSCNDQIFDAWKKLYLKDDEEDVYRYSKMFGKVCGDGLFVHPAFSSATIHSDVADTYVYQGAFQLRFNHDEEYGTLGMKKADWCECDHGDDLHLFLGFPFTPGELPFGAKFSVEEAVLSRKLMTYITNFAKTGNPNKGNKVNLKWPKYKRDGDFIIFNHDISTGKWPRDRMEFWEVTMKELKEKFPVEE